MLDLFCLSQAVHLRHLYVREYDLIAHVTASLRHISVVHVHSNEAIYCLIAFFEELCLNHCSQRHQIKRLVVDKEHFGLRAAFTIALRFWLSLDLLFVIFRLVPIQGVITTHEIDLNQRSSIFIKVYD